MEQILGIISFVSDVIPFILLLVHYKILYKLEYGLLLIWTAISILLNLSILYFDTKWHELICQMNLTIMPIFVLFIYYSFLAISKIRYVYLVALIVYLAFGFHVITTSNIYVFNNTLAAVNAFGILFLSFLTFIFFYKFTKQEIMLTNPAVWFTMGYLIYTSGNFFLFGFAEKFPNIFTEPGLWSIYLFANIIKNVFVYQMLRAEVKLVAKPPVVTSKENVQ